jgi:hypothetical protein
MSDHHGSALRRTRDRWKHFGRNVFSIRLRRMLAASEAASQYEPELTGVRDISSLYRYLLHLI